MNLKNIKVLRLLFIAVSCFLLLIVTIEVFELIKQSSKRNYIYSEIKRIEKENKIFRQEILLLEKDEFYLNLLARKKLGMIKEGEKIYKFDN
jgi:cell division protein FtsB|tara:strand:- start:3994 stop:4269 length:276 start_codon:yes stop_codon:yes gene_type:complete